MDRYIDADLIKNIELIPYKRKSGNINVIIANMAIAGAKQVVDKIQTADVQPVIHAHWEYRYDTGIYQTEFLCSRCKGLIETYSCTVDEVEYEYCPHCGAKMDEEVEDAKIHKHR